MCMRNSAHASKLCYEALRDNEENTELFPTLYDNLDIIHTALVCKTCEGCIISPTQFVEQGLALDAEVSPGNPER